MTAEMLKSCKDELPSQLCKFMKVVVASFESVSHAFCGMMNHPSCLLNIDTNSFLFLKEVALFQAIILSIIKFRGCNIH